jgi:nitroreductase
MVLQVIEQRRTVRRFSSTPVPNEHLMAILAAARYAPTAGNQQPWRFLVVRDREKLDRLEKRALQWYLERVREADAARGLDIDSIRARTEQLLQRALSAPVYVAVLVDREAPYERYLVQDGSLAVGNLMIAARALGYGTGFFTTFFPEGPMKEFFHIPDRYSLICFTPIGVPESWPEMPPKKPLEELVVFEAFGTGGVEGEHLGSGLPGRSVGVQAPEERHDRRIRP